MSMFVFSSSKLVWRIFNFQAAQCERAEPQNQDKDKIFIFYIFRALSGVFEPVYQYGALPIFGWIFTWTKLYLKLWFVWWVVYDRHSFEIMWLPTCVCSRTPIGADTHARTYSYWYGNASTEESTELWASPCRTLCTRTKCSYFWHFTKNLFTKNTFWPITPYSRHSS